jgi:hypothetical protein
MIFYYTFISGFSGTSLFEDWIRLSFNFLCSFPIMATGCFDKDVDSKVVLEHPELYKAGREGRDLNSKKILQTLLSAITHSTILLSYVGLAFPSMDIHGAGDYYTFGTAVYSCLLVDMNYRAAFITSTHNQYTFGSICASFILYAFYLVVYPCTEFVTSLLAPNMYMVPYHMVKHLIFWMCLVAVPATAITLDMFIIFCFQTIDPWGDGNRELFTYQQKDYELVANVPEEKAGSSPSSDARIDMSPFAQQTLPHKRFTFNKRFVITRLVGLGVANVFLGSWAVYASASAKQIRIHYEGPEGYDPWGTQDFEVVKAQDQCKEANRNQAKCRIEVPLHVDMEPPILLYYAIGPFYQNYNDYLKSEVPKELHGDVVPSNVRETFCIEPTRVDEHGEQIVPCGMKATSMFNDSFEIKGHSVDKSNLAWPEDLHRYQNPPDYKKRSDTSWLYDRYPDVVPEDEGVNNEQFLVWMRPSALQRVWNPYGYIRDKTLRKGTKLTVEIESNYPMEQMDGWKQLVLTTTGPMGGRHHGFGYCLLLSGVVCFILCVAVHFIDQKYGAPNQP